MKPVHPVLALALAGLPALAAAQGLTVAWRDKPPYHYTENGVDKGVMLERMKRAFALARIDAHFVKEPSKRIWANLQGGVTRYCSIGWYQLEERSAYAQFSVPIHIDRPHQVLTSPEAAHMVTDHASLASLLADRQLRLGVMDGVSYGPAIDTLIRRAGNQVLRRTVDTTTMVRMLQAGRFDYIFIDQDDWDYAQQRERGLAGSILLDFPDMPPGLQRHVACSKDVSPALMARLNRAIESTAVRAGAKSR
jgi:polar amino acid transport system substrate-binding protein